MSTIEQVEKLKEKANVTYEEAKTALEAANGDMLDAIIYLEKQGKVHAPKEGGRFTTSQASSAKDGASQKKKEKIEDEPDGETFSSIAGRFLRWCGRIIGKGNVHVFEVRRHGEVMVSIPLTVLILLLIFAFWIVVPLIVVGLFFGCRYLFRGPDLDKTGLNKMMNAAADAAADAAENIKREVQKEVEEEFEKEFRDKDAKERD